MVKLFKLKSWLTLAESADYLTSALQEPVTVADLLQLGEDEHLRLSVNLINGAAAKLGKMVRFEDANLRIFPNITGFGIPAVPPEIVRTIPKSTDNAELMEWAKRHGELFESKSLLFACTGWRVGEHVIQFEPEVTTIRGIWDLTMLGAEMLDVSQALQGEIGGTEVTGTILDGVLLVSDDGQTYANLQQHIEKKREPGAKWRPPTPSDYFPAGGLPDDAAIVLRPAALAQFLAKLDSGEEATLNRTSKTLDARERVTLLCIIGALAGHAKLDLLQPMKAGEIIASKMLPGDVKLSGRTIGEHLKAVREAMHSRKG